MVSRGRVQPVDKVDVPLRGLLQRGQQELKATSVTERVEVDEGHGRRRLVVSLCIMVLFASFISTTLSHWQLATMDTHTI